MPQVNKKVKKFFIITMIVLGAYVILYIAGLCFLPLVHLEFQNYMNQLTFLSVILLAILPLIYLNYKTFVKGKKSEKILLLLSSFVITCLIITISCSTFFFSLNDIHEYSNGFTIKRVTISFLDSKVEYFEPVTPFFMRKTGEEKYKGNY